MSARGGQPGPAATGDGAAFGGLPRIQLNLRELSGAFGDLGTDVPLIAGLVMTCGLEPGRVLIVFGLMQMASGWRYGLPMPVQPLKAVAAIAIAGAIQAPVIHGGGLAIGVIMLVLTAAGLLDGVRRVVPRPVIRGIQLGLGLQLSWLALSRYIPARGSAGWGLAAACLLLIWLLRSSRRCPPALPVLALGAAAAVFLFPDPVWHPGSALASWPRASMPQGSDVLAGLVLLALPQVPLSLGNSILATHQMATDLFPERRVQLRQIGYSYSVLNLVAPFCGGVPVCHGSGGMAGHYLFGARTGGSVLIYGAVLVALGVAGMGGLLQAFPLPVLGAMLLAEGAALARFAADATARRLDLLVCLLVAALALAVPYGFAVGLAVGTAVAWAPAGWRHFFNPVA